MVSKYTVTKRISRIAGRQMGDMHSREANGFAGAVANFEFFCAAQVATRRIERKTQNETERNGEI